MAVHAAAELLHGALHRGKVRVPGRGKTSKWVISVRKRFSDLKYSLALGLGHAIIGVFIHKDSVLCDESVGNGGFDFVNSLLVRNKFSAFGDVGRVRVGAAPTAAAPAPVATPTSTSTSASAAAKSSQLPA